MPGDAGRDEDMDIDMEDSSADEEVVEVLLSLPNDRRVYMLDLGVVGKE